jgi:hypothetical protein
LEIIDSIEPAHGASAAAPIASRGADAYPRRNMEL